MNLKKLNSEKILSLSAMFISLCTLIVFLYQTNLMRKQQYMSVYPHLSLMNYGTHTPNYKYVLANDGIGPAILKSIVVKTKDGKTYKDIIPYVVASIIQMRDSTLGFYHSNIHVGQLLPADSKIELIIANDNKISTSEKLYNILNADGLDINIEYESMYGERWKITNNSDIPIKK